MKKAELIQSLEGPTALLTQAQELPRVPGAFKTAVGIPGGSQ